ncbi:hypothetical protein AVEN_199369-1, partial [Araneus ventricosus]
MWTERRKSNKTTMVMGSFRRIFHRQRHSNSVLTRQLTRSEKRRLPTMDVYRRKRVALAYLVYKKYISKQNRRYWIHPFVDSRLSRVNVSVHRGLNSSRGVVSEKELVGSSDTEILEELSSQGVTAVRRINIKREGKLIPTKHIILTFNSTKLPSTIKAGFLSCPVKPYIPNPIRCFNCQRFGHSKAVCRGRLTCSKCSVIGHSANDCTSDPKCKNCSQAHTADSKLCPQFKTEKKIQELRVRKNISYLEAKKLIPEQKSVTYAQTVKTCLPQSTQTVDYTTKIHCHTCCCQSVAPNQSHNKSSSSTTLNEQPSTSKVPSPVKSKTPGKSKNTDNSKQMKKAGKWETVKES